MATPVDANNRVSNDRTYLEKQTILSMTAPCTVDNFHEETLDDDDFQLMPGIQLGSVRSFSGPHGEIRVTPIVVDFRSLLLSQSGEEIIKGVSNRELLHAVVALYAVSLSEMTPDTLYASVCEKWARTIVLLRDVSEALREVKSHHQQNIGKVSTSETCTVADLGPVTEEDICTEGDRYIASDEKPATFVGTFSDSEDETDTKEAVVDGTEEDFSEGLYSFLRRVRQCRESRRQQTAPLTYDNVHIENQLIAAATFEKSYVKPCDRVVHLTLIAVRRRYRKCKIGEYLLSQVKDMSVVGKYDAVVVHADNSALKFFRKFGFSDDVVLNSRWNDLAEQYTQCTLMSFMPPFTADSGGTLAMAELDISAMDSEIQRWRQRSIDAYRSEVSCVNRLRHEIVTLRHLVSSQQETISTLTASCEQLRRDKYRIEKEFMNYRLTSSKLALAAADLPSDTDSDDENDEVLCSQHSTKQPQVLETTNDA